SAHTGQGALQRPRGIPVEPEANDIPRWCLQEAGDEILFGKQRVGELFTNRQRLEASTSTLPAGRGSTVDPGELVSKRARAGPKPVLHLAVPPGAPDFLSNGLPEVRQLAVGVDLSLAVAPLPDDIPEGFEVFRRWIEPEITLQEEPCPLRSARRVALGVGQVAVGPYRRQRGCSTDEVAETLAQDG